MLSDKTELGETEVQLSLNEGVELSFSLINHPPNFEFSLEELSVAERLSLTWVRLSFEFHSENIFPKLPEGGVLSKITCEETIISELEDDVFPARSVITTEKLSFPS